MSSKESIQLCRQNHSGWFFIFILCFRKVLLLLFIFVSLCYAIVLLVFLLFSLFAPSVHRTVNGIHFGGAVYDMSQITIETLATGDLAFIMWMAFMLFLYPRYSLGKSWRSLLEVGENIFN